jgi:hypothetical protein
MSIHSAWKTLLAFSLAAAGACSHTAEPAAKAKPRVLVTISKETTRITEPLRSDGYPDYLEALNQRCAKGVTPENNAAVPFWGVMGWPYDNDRERSNRFFEMLGVPPPLNKKPSFVYLHSYADGLSQEELPSEMRYPRRSDGEAWKQEQLAIQRPWSKKEFPVLAGWLAANEKPMALVVEASKRPKYYTPIVADSAEPMFGVLLRAIGGEETLHLAARPTGPFNGISRALVARAMLRLDEGKIDEAREDVLTCHRLARLAAQGPFLAHVATADSVEAIACMGEQAFVGHGEFTTSQIRKMQADFVNLPSIAKMADTFDVGERFVHLDVVTTFARKTSASIQLPGDKDDPFAKSFRDAIVGGNVDWNVPLRMGNSWCDRILAAFHKPTRAEQVKALADLDAELQKMAKTVHDAKSVDMPPPGTPLAPISEWMGQAITTIVSPPFVFPPRMEERAMMQRELTILAFALAAYHAEYGSYPAKLAGLVPRYVKELPKDVFNNDAGLHYARQGNGYLLYSIGINEKDDGGKGGDDAKNGEAWDDLAVRMSGGKP